jgi:hypothetical protein
LWRARVSSIVPPFASAHSNSKPALATPLVTGNVISKKEWGGGEKKKKTKLVVCLVSFGNQNAVEHPTMSVSDAD